MKMKKNPFEIIQKAPHTGPVVMSFRARGPMLGNGEFHPPRKTMEIMADTINMLPYSARKMTANFMPEYSVKYPATSSDSASGISNGARFTSARDAMK